MVRGAVKVTALVTRAARSAYASTERVVEQTRGSRSAGPNAKPPRECRDFLRGFCEFGSGCKFLHVARPALPEVQHGAADAWGEPPPPAGVGQAANPSRLGKAMRGPSAALLDGGS